MSGSSWGNKIAPDKSSVMSLSQCLSEKLGLVNFSFTNLKGFVPPWKENIEIHAGICEAQGMLWYRCSVGKSCQFSQFIAIFQWLFPFCGEQGLSSPREMSGEEELGQSSVLTSLSFLSLVLCEDREESWPWLQYQWWDKWTRESIQTFWQGKSEFPPSLLLVWEVTEREGDVCAPLLV